MRRELLARRGSAQRGFTLLELVIVLAVIGFASLLAVASLDRMASSAAERNWSDRTLHELRRMRLLAASRGDVIQGVLDRRQAILTWTDLAAGETGRLELPENFAWAWGEGGFAQAPSSTEDPTLVLRFYPDGSAIGREFRLLLPSGRSHVFHVNGVSGRIWRGDEASGGGG